ncbi:hypothetical protein ANN_19115 [Periplaneta americana]|uniref:Endonuclease/exonuclease/phosphatase domain-containing protein n=1 Tax=Periplaneta americana TaxID=6978 RepID=A0ABQ8S8Y4_PERAM|nr:hypothetical protein ANN_19115 [Periplaneta americana]
MIECMVKILELVDPAIPTIIAGDLNCRLDKPDRKCRALLELMEEEGFQRRHTRPRNKFLVHHQKASSSKGGLLATEQHRTGTQSRTKVDPEDTRRSTLQRDTSPRAGDEPHRIRAA